ncbi:hypothetical protein HHE06_15480 [Helicobacter heilmannii]|nr:hypothetical protein HHE06_15480 [Helicobacter heilmannii]
MVVGGIVGGYHPRVKEKKIALGVLNPTGVESFYPCVCPPFLSAFMALRVWGVFNAQEPRVLFPNTPTNSNT